ncbi:hypothetical protein IFM89_010428 [Coptis chinensis]|uniref:RING-type E3 ubiquitin transferase n=1 Tax=Coptis chinensis TaxID=261450 RepID=A0A835I156_9MAGN|nr:hypothetical protein IFM89_010428 [Coptis chinensis]
MGTRIVEKVYVAVGNNLQEGLSTLEWTLKNWSSQLISIVILHINGPSKNFVHTPYGKLPASAVNDEKLEVLRMFEQEKISKLLSKYMAFCGKVIKVEVLKFDNSEQPIDKAVVGLITRLQITKLVMGISLMRSSTRKARSAISGSFYVHKFKPDYCDLFIVCGGKLVFLKEQKDEEHLEDDQGMMVAKMKERGNFKGWLGKIFTERDHNHQAGPSDSRDQQKSYPEEIENYLQLLSKLTVNDEDYKEDDSSYRTSPIEGRKLDDTGSRASDSNNNETMKAGLEEAQKVIEEKRKETQINIDRQKGAERIISLCNQKAEELQCCIDKEIDNQIDLKRNLDAATEQILEITRDIEESKNRLNSAVELQTELARKISSSSSAKPLAESELEKTVAMRAEILIEIDKLREQKDVFLRRIEFCKEEYAITSATHSRITNRKYREFTENEIRDATDNFAEGMKLRSDSVFSIFYKGRIKNSTIAIKMQTIYDLEQLHNKMEILCNIRHPHFISTLGACFEPKCIVFEYMHNGSLQDNILSHMNTSTGRRTNRIISWYIRIRIAVQICSGLGFLHSAQPQPIPHNDLSPSNILLDRNLVAKITNIKMIPNYHTDSQLEFDVRAFGYIMLLLLTGTDENEMVDKVTKAIECGTIISILDEKAIDWPLDLAEEFACIAMRCISMESPDSKISIVMLDLEELMKKAIEITKGGWEMLEWLEALAPCSLLLCPTSISRLCSHQCGLAGLPMALARENKVLISQDSRLSPGNRIRTNALEWFSLLVEKFGVHLLTAKFDHKTCVPRPQIR